MFFQKIFDTVDVTYIAFLVYIHMMIALVPIIQTNSTVVIENNNDDFFFHADQGFVQIIQD